MHVPAHTHTHNEVGRKKSLRAFKPVYGNVEKCGHEEKKRVIKNIEKK